MKILIINRYFYPDEAATSRMATSLATALAAQGREVHAIASRNEHQDSRRTLPRRERVDGVAIHRVWTTRFGRHWLPGRAVDYLTFHASVAWKLFRMLRAGDLCIVCTDPPFLSVSALVPVFLRRAVLVNWIMDLFPEVPIALGMMRPGGVATRALLWLRDLSLRVARANVAPIGAMADLLRRRGIPADRVAVIHHWSDGEVLRPLDRAETRFRALWGLGDKFVVGYSGNLGRAHDFSTIIDAAERLADRTDIVFLFVGAGYRRAWVEREVSRRGLRNVVMQPLQPREVLPETLAVADVHLVSLMPEMEPYIVPSKFYGIAAAGRPTLFVGDPSGEIARRVREGECGAASPIGDGEGLAATIRRLADAPEECRRLGANARRLFDASFTRERGIGDWCDVLAAVQAGPAPDPARAGLRGDPNVTLPR